MGTEFKRTIVGATNFGQVAVIERDIEDGEATNPSPTTKKSYVVKQGVRQLIETDEESEATAFAATLVKYHGIIEMGVDEHSVRGKGRAP